MNTFEDFLDQVSGEHKDAVAAIHKSLTADGYKAKIENKATGMFVAYSHPKTKRAFLNFFFRKSGLQARLYAEGHKSYLDFISKLSKEQEQRISKAKTCDGCAPTCTKGYKFSIQGNEYYPCRYYAFHFEINATNKSTIIDLINLEKETRQ